MEAFEIAAQLLEMVAGRHTQILIDRKGRLLNQQSNDTSNARMTKATQSQSGSLNAQQREIGTAAEGSKADVSVKDDYNSHNTARLSVDGMAKLLLDLDIVKRALAGERIVE